MISSTLVMELDPKKNSTLAIFFLQFKFVGQTDNFASYLLEFHASLNLRLGKNKIIVEKTYARSSSV